MPAVAETDRQNEVPRTRRRSLRLTLEMPWPSAWARD